MNNVDNSPFRGLGGIKIAIIGYGKMGKTIESIALERGHTVDLKIDIESLADFTKEKLQQCDVAIEFTGPHSAKENILKCLDAVFRWLAAARAGWPNGLKWNMHARKRTEPFYTPATLVWV